MEKRRNRSAGCGMSVIFKDGMRMVAGNVACVYVADVVAGETRAKQSGKRKRNYRGKQRKTNNRKQGKTRQCYFVILCFLVYKNSCVVFTYVFL